MFCPKCGKQLTGQHLFCPECGFKFQETSPQNPSETRSSIQDKPKRKVLPWVIALCVVLLLSTGILYVTGILPSLFASDTNDEEAYLEDDNQEDQNQNEKPASIASTGGLEALAKDIGAIWSSIRGNGNSAWGEPAQPDTRAVEGFSPDYSISGNVVVWTSDNALEESINSYAKAAFPNLNITVNLYPIDEYRSRIYAYLASGDPSFDIFTLDTPMAKNIVESGLPLDLTGLGEREPEVDLFYYTEQYGTDSGGVVRAYPYRISPGAMFYKRSLAQKYLGTDDPASIQAMVSSPSDIKSFAEQLYQASNGLCKFSSFDEMNLPSKSWRDSPWIINNQLIVDNAMVDFLQIYKSMYDSGYLSSCRQWDTSWFDSIKGVPVNGKEEVFSYFLPKWGLDYVLKTEKYADNEPVAQGDWAMIEGPFSYFYGETYLFANGATQNSEAAKTVIQYLTMNKDYLESRARDNNEFSPSAVVNSMLIENGADPYLHGQNTYNILMDIAYTINGSVYSKYDEQLDTFWDEQAEAFVTGKLSLNDALAKFKSSVTALDPSIQIP